MEDKAQTTATRSVFSQPAYSRFWIGRVLATLSFQMAGVAVGWQIYELTHSTFALGMVGLAQFLPMLALNLLIGHVADRFDRRIVVAVSRAANAILTAFLAITSWTHVLRPSMIFVTVAGIGVLRALEIASTQAMVPGLVEKSQVPQALAWSSSAAQTASIVGPALGGLLYAFGAQVPYLACACLYAAGAFYSYWIPLKQRVVNKAPLSLDSMLSGIHFIRQRRKILGAISLDLFAMLLGGATALLPAYARDILHVGPWGLGLLRLSPAIGALWISIFLGHRPIQRRAGLKMFIAVMLFGLSIVGFALSRSVWLSMVMLCASGAADVISVVVRSSLVQLETPDEMRGRVSAINALFIGTSNQLGEFESGVTASWFGIVPATIIGGLGSVVVALIWMKKFPELRNLQHLGELAEGEEANVTI